MNKVYLAGGCFWGVEKYFTLIKGVVNTQVGYGQSKLENITYQEACSQKYDAVEAVLVEYDDSISLEKLIDYLFLVIDPTLLNQQGNDKGVQYRTGIYCTNMDDVKRASNYLELLQQNFEKKIVVECQLLENFYVGEEYHQSYLDKNPQGYCHINFGVLKKGDLK